MDMKLPALPMVPLESLPTPPSSSHSTELLIMTTKIQSLPSKKIPEFLSFPPEIRNAIYEMLVTKEFPIRVCSPLRKHNVNCELTSESFAVLLRLNKQINTEASTTFYSKNPFILGNGAWCSTISPNVHGLKAFLKRVPQKYLAHIKNVIVEIHCRQTFHPEFNPTFNWVPNLGGGLLHELGSLNDAANLHSISRALATRFKGLERLEYRKLEGPSLYEQPLNPETKRLTKEEATKQLEKTLILVVKNTNLKEIQSFSDSLVDMQTAMENIRLTVTHKYITKPKATRSET